MAVKLRLTRRGKKKQPFYRIVAADSRTARDGKYIEKIGLYNPLPDPAEILIDEKKVFYWLNQGAIPSDTVKNLLSKKGIILKWSLKKKGLEEAKIEEEFNKWEAIQIEQQKKKEALAAQADREKQEKNSKEKNDEDADSTVKAEEQVEEKTDVSESDEKVEDKVESTETAMVDEKVASATKEEVAETKTENIESDDEQTVDQDVESKPEENL